MFVYQNEIKVVVVLKEKNGSSWSVINFEYVVCMCIQNCFKIGLDIVKYIVVIMCKDMVEYDVDFFVYIQLLGCWYGFIGQQKLILIKKYLKIINKCYFYLFGWMVVVLCFDFGLLLDQFMYEKIVVFGLIEELYIFLCQVDVCELDLLFIGLDVVCVVGDKVKEVELLVQIDNFEIYVVLIIVDIDVGFGNVEVIYLLVKKMIEVGVCCIQIENQVFDEKQCGYQDGKVIVLYIDFFVKINVVCYVFFELGVDDGVIVVCIDFLGVGLIKQIVVINELGDLGDLYNFFLDCEEIFEVELGNGDVVIKCEGKLLCLKCLVFNLFQFCKGIGEDCCVLDCIILLQNGVDLFWIEIEKLYVGQIKVMVDCICEVILNVKLVYNNSLFFNWILNFCQQVFDVFVVEGKDVFVYDCNKLMSVEYDDIELVKVVDEKICIFQCDGLVYVGIFYYLIILLIYYIVVLFIDNLVKGYFVDEGMLVYVKGVQCQELCQGIVCVKYQNMVGFDIGDNYKEYFVGEVVLKVSGKDNIMNQFY